MNGFISALLAVSMAAAPPVSGSATAVGSSPVSTPARPADPTPDRRRPRRPGWACEAAAKECRAISIAGIVLTTLGVAAIGTGIGLTVRPNESIAGEPAFERSYAPAGAATIGAGAVVAIGGILMLVSGRIRARRARR